MSRTAILLDLDGTLIDPLKGVSRCIRHALATLEIPWDPADSLAWCIGPPIHHSFARLVGPQRQHLLQKAIDLYRERYSERGIQEHVPYEGVSRALAELASKHDLHLATSKPRVYAERILKNFSFEQHFRSIHGSELDGRNSDKGELIAHVLLTERISAPRAVMIGDREFDGIGARKNGMPWIGVTWGYGSAAELLAAGASSLAAHPSELAPICNALV